MTLLGAVHHVVACLGGFGTVLGRIEDRGALDGGVLLGLEDPLQAVDEQVGVDRVAGASRFDVLGQDIGHLGAGLVFESQGGCFTAHFIRPEDFHHPAQGIVVVLGLVAVKVGGDRWFTETIVIGRPGGAAFGCRCFILFIMLF